MRAIEDVPNDMFNVLDPAEINDIQVNTPVMAVFTTGCKTGAGGSLCTYCGGGNIQYLSVSP